MIYRPKRRGSSRQYLRSTNFTSTRHQTAPSASKPLTPLKTIIVTLLAPALLKFSSVSPANTSFAMAASKAGSPKLDHAPSAGTSSPVGFSSKTIQIPEVRQTHARFLSRSSPLDLSGSLLSLPKSLPTRILSVRIACGRARKKQQSNARPWTL